MRAGIALGSNVGDSLRALRDAAGAICHLRNVSGPFLHSRTYETLPVDMPLGSAPVLNAAIEVEFHGQPVELLRALLALESRLGRQPLREQNASRPIDLDLLYCGGEIVALPELRLPHPRIAQRAFVLAPLNDIRPELVLPGYVQPVAALLALTDQGGVRPFVQRQPEARLPL